VHVYVGGEKGGNRTQQYDHGTNLEQGILVMLAQML